MTVDTKHRPPISVLRPSATPKAPSIDAITDLTFFVDQDQPVGIPVKTKANISPMFQDRLSGTFRVGRTTAFVYIFPFGCTPMEITSAPSSQSASGAAR